VEYFKAISSLLGGLLLLSIFSGRLVHWASNLALRLKVSPLFIGITVVAASTSLPELFVCVNAQLEGSSDLAIGNIVGSNIFNIGVVLGSVLVWRRRSHTQGGTLEGIVLIMATLALVAYLHLNQGLDGFSILTRNTGILLVIGFLILIIFSYTNERKRSAALSEIDEMTLDESSLRSLKLTSGLILATAGLWFGGYVLVDGALSLTSLLDIHETAFGLTVIAAGTGAPELFASVAAIRRGSASMAVGNVVGSNLFNTIAVVGVAAIVSPLEVKYDVIQVDLLVMIIMTISISLLLNKSPRLQQSLGTFLLAFYVMWLLHLVIEKH
jgi:cation:H+ antiporter